MEGNILVAVEVNGVEATFILDTGADRTLMGEDVVRNLGLERDGWVASIIQGVCGIEQRPNALPRSLRLGDRDAAPQDAHRRYQRDGRPVSCDRRRRSADRRTARP